MNSRASFRKSVTQRDLVALRDERESTALVVSSAARPRLWRVSYFLPAEEPRAIIPSATANRSADNRGRFSASAGAVCANSDANWGGLGAGGGGAGCRLTIIGSRAMSPRTKATAATINAAVGGLYSDVSQKNKAAKSAITTIRKKTAATRPKAAGTAMRLAAVC